MMKKNQLLTESGLPLFVFRAVYGSITLLLLFLLAGIDYPLFGLLTKGYTILIAFTIYMFVLNSGRSGSDHIVFYIAIVYMFVGILDFIALLSFTDIIFSNEEGSTRTILFGTSARWIQLSAFLVPVLFRHKLKTLLPIIMQFLYGAIVIIFVILIHFAIRSDYFSSKDQLVLFRNINGYLLSFIFFLLAIYILLRRSVFGRELAVSLVTILALTSLSSGLLVFFGNKYQSAVVVANLLRVVSAYLLYHLVASSYVRKPMDELQKQVDLQNNKISVFNDSIEKIVNEKIRYLTEKNLELEKSIHKNKAVAKEVYCRTKNNLQIISSILDLRGDISKEHYTDIQAKIQSIALIQQMIYRSENGFRFDLKLYLKRLAGLILKIYGKSKKIKVTIDGQTLDVDLDTAIPIGLISNELIANSILHAFPEGRSGKIEIEVCRRNSDAIQINYRDDGIGLPRNFVLESNGSLGLKNVESIVVEQLLGTMRICRDNGFSIKITIPVLHDDLIATLNK
jgi:two-component sensor histidine kinase